MGKKGKRENLIIGLDIGTTKICAIVGEVTDGGIVTVNNGSMMASRGRMYGLTTAFFSFSCWGPCLDWGIPGRRLMTGPVSGSRSVPR